MRRGRLVVDAFGIGAMMTSSGNWVATLLSLLLFGDAGAPKPSIGAQISDFELPDCRGVSHRLGGGQGGRLVAVVFLAAECPVAEMYANRLARLADEFEPRGVAFFGIAPDGRDSPSTLAHFAGPHGFRFPILLDRAGEIAARLGATRTPEVVLLDDRRVIRYRGRIDDQYAVGSRRSGPGRRDLATALEELLTGRPVSRPETEAVGCPIERPGPRPEPAPTPVTYSRDIAPILQRRCGDCHRPGQIGPFSLSSYRQASGRAEAIAEAVGEGRMPPWHADPRYGEFANDAHLSGRERRLIAEWARGGAPEGDPADLPAPVAYPEGWRIPKPDRVVSIPAPFTVPAEGVVDYQYFEVDIGLKEDKWVRAVEVRPGNPKVVHHCTVFLKAPSRRIGDRHGQLESAYLAITTPGAPPIVLPEGMARRIPAGSRLLFEVHYTPIGTIQEDRTSIGLVFADPEAVRKEVATHAVEQTKFRIPPREPNHRVEMTRLLPEESLLLAMFPHMHVRGKSFRYEAVYPDGHMEILLDVPRYDFNWQNRYELAEPKRLPAGTALRFVAHYDNSESNPANPDPRATVFVGRQSWEEMCLATYEIALADQDLTRPLTWGENLRGVAQRSTEPATLFAIGSVCAVSLVVIRVRKLRKTASGDPV